MQVLLNNRQVYHTSMKTIDLDVNTYLTIDPKVGECMHAHVVNLVSMGARQRACMIGLQVVYSFKWTVFNVHTGNGTKMTYIQVCLFEAPYCCCIVFSAWCQGVLFRSHCIMSMEC